MSRRKLTFKERNERNASRQEHKKAVNEQWIKRQEIIDSSTQLGIRLTFLNDMANNLWYTAHMHTFSADILSPEGKTTEELLKVHEDVFDKLRIIRTLGIATKNLMVKNDEVLKSVKVIDKNKITEDSALALIEEIIPALTDITTWFNKCLASFCIFKDDLPIIKEQVGESYYVNLNFLVEEAERYIDGADTTDVTVSELGDKYLSKIMQESMNKEIVDKAIADAGTTEEVITTHDVVTEEDTTENQNADSVEEVSATFNSNSIAEEPVVATVESAVPLTNIA